MINGDNNLLSSSQVLCLEDIRRLTFQQVDPQNTLNSVFNFLEVKPFNTIKEEVVNSRKYPPMNQLDREFLKEKFTQEIIDIENLLGWDLSN